jgi:putative ABC transport system permease protein
MVSLTFAFSMARRNMVRRKFRSALTILGIIVAVTTMVSVSMIMSGLQREVVNVVNDIVGPGLIIRSAGSATTATGLLSFTADPDIPESISYIFEEMPGVAGVYSTVEFAADVNGYTTSAQAIRVDDFNNVYKATFEEGTGFSELSSAQSVLLTKTVADQLKAHVNDTVIINPRKAVGVGAGEPFTVVGILNPMGAMESFIGVIVPLETAQSLIGREGYVSRIMIKLKEPGYAAFVKTEIESMFPQVEVRTQEDILKNVNDILNNVNVVLLALGSISAIVGAIGVMNTVLTSVYERTREIGIMKAIGAENTHILSIFLTESLLMGLVGGILGAVFGTILTFAMRFLISRMLLGIAIPLTISPTIYVIGILIALFISEMASLYPAWKAANTRPVEALRFG